MHFVRNSYCEFASAYAKIKCKTVHLTEVRIVKKIHGVNRAAKCIFAVLLAVVLCVTGASTLAFAANISTVEAITQDISAALTYAEENVGINSGAYTIPGLIQTVTRNSAGDTVQLCDGMVPQGMCFASNGDYLLISAYCNCGAGHRSVIYVINASTKAYETTLILDTSCHVGGIAAKGDYIWVCDTSSGNYLRSYKVQSMLDALTHKYWTVYTQSKIAVATAPSYMCCANGYLYIGKFSSTETTSTIYYYSISGTSLSKVGSFTVTGIPKIQGISIRDGYMVLSCSYGRTNASDVYIFQDSGLFKASGKTYAKASARHYKLPNMVEACYVGSTYTYFLFESGAKTYRESANTRPLDKYVRYKSSDLFAGTLAKPAPEPSEPELVLPTDITSIANNIEKTVGAVKAFKGINEKTEVLDIISAFEQSNEYLQIRTPAGQTVTSGIVGTGYTVNLVINGSVVVSYSISVKGDVNGDGVITSGDYMTVVSSSIGVSPLNALETLSADVDGSGGISAADALALASHVNGVGKLN